MCSRSGFLSRGNCESGVRGEIMVYKCGYLTGYNCGSVLLVEFYPYNDVNNEQGDTHFA